MCISDKQPSDVPYNLKLILTLSIYFPAETARPKDIGGVNVVGLVSVFIYTILLSSLAAV